MKKQRTKKEHIPRVYETSQVWPEGTTEEEKERVNQESIERAARGVYAFYVAHGTIYAEGKEPRKDK